MTKTSYLTLATAALHRMGGFGADFHQNHVLAAGRLRFRRACATLCCLVS